MRFNFVVNLDNFIVGFQVLPMHTSKDVVKDQEDLDKLPRAYAFHFGIFSIVLDSYHD